MGETMISEAALTWYKEVDGKRVCALYNRDWPECHLMIGAIDFSPLRRLANLPHCFYLLDHIKCDDERERCYLTCDDDNEEGEGGCHVVCDEVEKECFGASLAWDLCTHYDKTTITSLLMHLGFRPNRFKVLDRDELVLALDLFSERARMPEYQLIITEEDAEVLGLNFTSLGHFDKEEFLAFNALVKKALETGAVKAVVQVNLGLGELDEARYWVIIYDGLKLPESFTIFPDQLKNEREEQPAQGVREA
jgi:hypothetical protein